MLRRTTKIALEVAAAVFAGVVVLSALVFWRASTQPIPLEFMKDRVAEALVPAGRGSVTIGELRMEWRGWSRLFEVRVTSLRFDNDAGGVILFAPSADIALSGPRLLLGEIAPVQIAVDQPVLNLERGVDGTYQLYGAAPSGEESSRGDLFSVLQEPGADGSGGLAGLERLERFFLRNATVRMTDRTGTFENIRLSGLDGLFERERDGWRVEARADLAVGEETLEIRGDGNYFYGSRELDGAILFKGLAPELVLSHVPQSPADLAVSGNLSGSVAFSLEDFRSLLNIDIIATTSDGEVTFGSMLPAPVPYDSLRFQVGYDARDDAVALRNFVLERDGMTVSLSGSLRDLAEPALELRTRVTAMPVDEVEGIWPPELFDLARNWATRNLKGGVITEMAATLDGRLDIGETTRLTDVSLEGFMEFDGVTVHYLRPLAPALGVGGRATFTEKRIDASVTRGYLDDIQLKRADVSLTGIHTVSDDYATIEAEIDGPISDILKVLNTKPFGYADALGLAPEEVGGTGSGIMRFEMPLLRVMTFDMVDLQAEGRFTGVSLPSRTTRLPFANGEMAMDLDKTGMLLDGTGELSGLPTQIAFLQSFEEEAEIRRRTHVIVRPDVEKIAQLGLDMRRFAEGEVELDATIEEPRDGDTRVDLVMGLQNTELRVGELEWEKPAGAAGTFRAQIRARDDAVVAIDRFQVATADLAASGAVQFSPENGRPTRFTVDRLQLGETDLSGVIASDGKGGYTANIKGPFADLRELVDGLDHDGAKSKVPLVVNARVDQVLIGKLEPMQDVTLLLEDDGDGNTSLAANGLIGAEPVDLFYTTASGTPHFDLSTQSAGNVMKAFEGFDSISGGRLIASGELEERDGLSGWNVSLSVLDFDLVDAPVMAQLLSAMSLTGLPAVVQGRGVHFSRMDVNMHVSDEKLVLERLLAQGASLGISASGEIDRVKDETDLSGMVVPAYVLNEVLGSIPILGTLLTGGEGEGFLASEFSVSGSLKKPQVTVNPLTALTPGIFRNLFRLGDAPPKDPEPAEPPAQDRSP
ncbi:AsmA-like C-terminal domain-containing protein [Nisaea acidiphila]|uniref:AsmA-like C-terminal domain-containing protein n=1 Tax=Nisaea acidiphila TaxID=1862145 RepID=A0A9J7AZG8_9PROT|nr:AsmA-like C-terminal domain-containing protein [Nisaea acidiphila]UUX50845.1 AsmA-like C-terminal domain-containing protein [Nisaea acidiphila]